MDFAPFSLSSVKAAAADAQLDKIEGRGLEFSQTEMAQVEAILKDVRENGDEVGTFKVSIESAISFVVRSQAK